MLELAIGIGLVLLVVIIVAQTSATDHENKVSRMVNERISTALSMIDPSLRPIIEMQITTTLCGNYPQYTEVSPTEIASALNLASPYTAECLQNAARDALEAALHEIDGNAT